MRALDVISLFILVGVAGAGTMDQGLFYSAPALAAAAVIAIVATARFVFLRPLPVSFDWTDLGLLVLAIGYVISLAHALRPQDAMTQTALVASGTVCYAALRLRPVQPMGRSLVSATVVFTALVVLGIGLLKTTGHLTGTWAGIPGPFSSTFQYHNAYAAFTACGAVLAGSLAVRTRQPLLAGVGAAAAAVLTSGVLLSLSRGMYVVLPAVWLTWALLHPHPFRARALLLLIAVAAGAVAGAHPLFRVLSGGGLHGAFEGLGLAAGVAGSAYLALRPAAPILGRIPRYARLTAAAFILFSVALGVGAVGPRLIRLVPHVLAARASSLTLADASVDSRIVMFETAAQLTPEVLPFGDGGGAWLDLYHNASPVLFVANETHSFPAQVALETGLAGLLGLLITAIGLARRAGNARRKDAAAWGMLFGLGVLVVHAMFDFDFSFFSLALLAWIIAGTTGAPTRDNVRFPSRRRALELLLSAGVALATTVLAVSVGEAQSAYRLADRSPAVAARWSDAALRLDPWNSVALGVLGRIGPMADRLRALATRAHQMAHDPDAWATYALALENAHRAGAFQAGQTALSLGAWNGAAVWAAARADLERLSAPTSSARRTQTAVALAKLEAEISPSVGSLIVPPYLGLTGTTFEGRLEATLGMADLATGAPGSAVIELETASRLLPSTRPLLRSALLRAAQESFDEQAAALAASWPNTGHQ